MRTRSQLRNATSNEVKEEPPTKKETNDRSFNILVGVTGSVAAVKLIELIQRIKSKFPRPFHGGSTDQPPAQATASIRIVLTKNSQHFAAREEIIKKLDDELIEVYDDDDEWKGWSKLGDPVLHIELRKWADIMLIAPLDANSMAKIANGICDNLLTCIVRAWDTSKPLVYCPAMNVHMWSHPITRDQLCKLQSFGYLRIDCVEKRLACGDVGMGGMAAVDTIADKVVNCLVEPLTKKPTLPNLKLNRHPTYPIIITSGNSDSSSAPKNQITIRKLPATVPSATTSNCFSATNYGLTRIPRPQGSNVVSSSNIYTSRLPNGRFQTATAVSISEASRTNCSEADDEEDDNNIEEDEAVMDDDDESFDIDPTKLLEQTMVTGDDAISPFGTDDDSPIFMTHNNNTQNNNRNIPPNTNGFAQNGTVSSKVSSVGGGNFTKLDGSSPLFNTSKFLTTCYNEQRGCFTCKICKNHYKNRKSMARHLKEQHVQGNIYQCRPCNVSYKRREKLMKHYKERHPGVQL